MKRSGWRKWMRRQRSRARRHGRVPGWQRRRNIGSRGGSQTHLRPAYEAGEVSDLPAVLRKLACVRPQVGRPWRRCRWWKMRFHPDFVAGLGSRPDRRRSFGTRPLPPSRAMSRHPTHRRRLHGAPAHGNRHSQYPSPLLRHRLCNARICPAPLAPPIRRRWHPVNPRLPTGHYIRRLELGEPYQP